MNIRQNPCGINEATRIEKIILFFTKERRRKISGLIDYILVYKTLGKNYFFITKIYLPPEHINCRCVLVDYAAQTAKGDGEP